MSEQSEKTILDLTYFGDQILEALNILERSSTEVQITGIVFSIVLSWLLSKWLWIKFKRKFPKISQFDEIGSKLPWQNYGALILHCLLTPFLCLLCLNSLKIWFIAEGRLFGLINEAIYLVRAYGGYRFFLIWLYIFFPVKAVERYQNNFFAPLFVLFATKTILNLFIDLQSVLQVPVIQLFGEPVTLADILIPIIGLYFWFVGTSLIQKLAFKFLSSVMAQESSRSNVLSLILRYFLIGLGIVLISGYVGVSGTALTAVSGGLSVGIGFGLKEVISNFVSGIWLLFEGTLKPGDIVTVKGEMSQVRKLGVRATTVQVLGDNSEEVIPNQTFFTQNITTLTGSNTLICRSLKVGASYNSDPQKVIELLVQVASEHPTVLAEPSPVAFLTGFGDSSLDFELKFWLKDPLIGKRTTSEIGCEIWRAFDEQGIQIPYPQRDVHIYRDLEK